jgi:protein-S-isoprenylcysteine O-methyltransferase Ste14
MLKTRIPPPIILLLAAACMWMLDRWLPLQLCIAPPWNRIGGLPIAAGFAIDVASVVFFRRAGTTVNPMDPGKASRLVTGGPFRISRNPMYLGLLLMLIGWALWLGSASPWFIPPLFVVAVTVLQIVPEEHALAKIFGEQYTVYQNKVARWLGGTVRK